MPRRESAYQIRSPSGDHAASNSGPAFGVTRLSPVPSAFAVYTSSSEDSTRRPVRETTSIGVPITTGSREWIGEPEGSGDSSVLGVAAGALPASSDGDLAVHDIDAEPSTATRTMAHPRCRSLRTDILPLATTRIRSGGRVGSPLLATHATSEGA